MSNLSENIASQIRSIRKDRKMSLAEVATIAFGDPNRKIQISNIETEKSGATTGTIEKIFDALNCDLVVVPREKLKELSYLLKK